MRRPDRSRSNSTNIMSYIIIVVISALLLYIGNRVATRGLALFDDEYAEEILRAVVEEIEWRNVESFGLDENTTIDNISVAFRARLESGARKGEIVSAIQTLDSFIAGRVAEVRKGDKVLLIRSIDDEADWYFSDYLRSDSLLVFGLIFVLALLVFGRKKGFNTIVSIAFTCIAIFFVFVPAILSGKNIYLWSVIICVYSVLMTFLVVNGISKKTFAASIGSLCGIAVSGLLTVIMDRVLSLSGFVDEDSVYLTYLPTENPIDLRAIIFAAIVIGAMGAIMDVAMSIASSLWEIREESQAPTYRGIIRSGINIGRDVLGTMANTLILAYIGSSLSVVLLLSVYSSSLLGLMNREMIIVEILQALVGSFGLLFTMPFTSLICAALYVKRSPAQETERWNIG
jgi:uncharacterized membrane protein